MNQKRMKTTQYSEEQSRELREMASKMSWSEKTDIPVDLAQKLVEWRPKDQVLCTASGAPDTTRMHGKDGVFMAFDFATKEKNPKPGEPELNVYHPVFTCDPDKEACVMHLYRHGADNPHWCTSSQFDEHRKKWGLSLNNSV